MKAPRILMIAAWAIAVSFTQDLMAQGFAVKSYKVTVNGTSSLHDWESSAQRLEAKGTFVVTNNTLSDIRDVAIKIPVTSLKSTKGRIMDNKTYDAFNHEKNPDISFVLTGKTINTSGNTIKATGNLSMAGVTKPIDLTVTYKILAGGDLQVTGSRKLNMEDFKMEPPTAMMGAIVVGEEVTVTFDLVLSQGSIVKTSR